MASNSTESPVEIREASLNGKTYKVAVLSDQAKTSELPRRILRQAQNRGNGNEQMMGDELLWAICEEYLEKADLNALYDLSVADSAEVLRQAYDPKA